MRTQAEHDAAHPGKICRNCPTNLASERYLRDVAAHLRLPWWKRWFRRP